MTAVRQDSRHRAHGSRTRVVDRKPTISIVPDTTPATGSRIAGLMSPHRADRLQQPPHGLNGFCHSCALGATKPARCFRPTTLAKGIILGYAPESRPVRCIMDAALHAIRFICILPFIRLISSGSFRKRLKIRMESKGIRNNIVFNLSFPDWPTPGDAFEGVGSLSST